MKFLALLVFVLCISGVSVLSQAKRGRAEFTPGNGFGGHSEGTGMLRLFLGKRGHFHVESHGYDMPEGTIRLDHTVTFEGKPSQRRTWMLKAISQDHFTGTLSDAPGRVTGHTNGSRLMLKYRVKGPLIMHQTLVLMPDGKTIDNLGKITFLGVTVGHLHETITRKDWAITSNR
ncbi:MAG: DUF3833 family protein [Pyrinomonadaceae bacterium]